MLPEFTNDLITASSGQDAAAGMASGVSQANEENARVKITTFRRRFVVQDGVSALIAAWRYTSWRAGAHGNQI